MFSVQASTVIAPSECPTAAIRCGSIMPESRLPLCSESARTWERTNDMSPGWLTRSFAVSPPGAAMFESGKVGRHHDESLLDPLLEQGVVDEPLGVQPVREHDDGKGLAVARRRALASGCPVGAPTAGYRTQVVRLRDGRAGALPLAGVPRLWSTRLSVSRPTPYGGCAAGNGLGRGCRRGG